MATEGNFETAEACYARGIQCATIGRIDEALAEFQKALALNPNFADAYFSIGQLHGQRGELAQAVSALKKATELKPELVPAEAHCNLGHILASSGHINDGIGCYQRAIAIKPEFIDAHSQLANLFMQIGELDEATRCYERALSVNPELGKPTNTEHVNFSFANKLEKVRRTLASLLEELDRCPNVLSVPPRISNQYFYEADSAARQGKLAKAVTGYEEAVKSEADFAAAHFCLGQVLSAWGNITFNAEKLQAASESFKKVVYLQPENAEAHYALGKAFLVLRDMIPGEAEKLHERAQLCYRHAISLKSDFLEAHCDLGVALHFHGRIVESLAHFGRYYELKDARARSHPLGRLGIRFIGEGNTYAMGHLAYLPECYLKMQMLGWLPTYRTVLMASPTMVANFCLLNYWKKYFEVVVDPARIKELSATAKQLDYDTALARLPDGKVMNVQQALSVVQMEWEAQKRPPLMSLLDEDFERGWSCLEQMGVPKGAWFVSLHVREGGFKHEGDGIAPNYHRNCNIDTYLSAVKEITGRGGWVVRMGEATMKPMASLPQVVDYAHSKFKCDWMDIFLLSQCRFYLGASAGVFTTPQLFGVPVALTNYPPPSPMQYGGKDIYIPKLLWNERENRKVTFGEMMTAPIVFCENGKYLTDIGLKFIDNTDDEIRDVAMEMLARTENAQVYDGEDERLQARYRGLLPKDAGVIISRIGRSFLRNYADLLPN